MLHFTDEELARRAGEGHISCFEEILSRYRSRVFRLCLRWAGNRDDAEDWAQECFVRAFGQLGRYDCNLPFAPWLLRLTTNTCINLAKARSRHTTRCETLDEYDWEDEGIPTHAPLESADEARRVRSAVQVLPANLRAAILLRFVEELSFREISEVLGVPLQTVVTRCKRAVEMVRQNFEREEEQTRIRSRKEVRR